MQEQINRTQEPTSFKRYWLKLPLVVRAVLIGFVVNTLGVGTWVLTLSFIPAPWSVVVMGFLLIFYWRYFSGGWKPISTQAFRKSCIRKTKLEKSVWTWGLIAAFFLIVFLSAGLVLTFRVVEFEPEVFKTASYLDTGPRWIVWVFLIMASMVAGICEEVGFRGYMQAPMEKKYGPMIAISITSIIFVMAHLHQAWAGGILIHIFVVSFMLGYLAFASKSLLPGIIAHTSFDIVNFSYWWSDVAGTFTRKPIGMTGVDLHFIITAVIVVIATIGFVVGINKLLGLKKKQQSKISSDL